MSNELQIDLQKHSDEATILHISGDVTNMAKQALTEACNQAFADITPQLILHLRDIDYMSSTGMAAIMGAVFEARKRNLQATIVVPHAHYQKIFLTMGLDRYAAIYGSLNEALDDKEALDEEGE